MILGQGLGVLDELFEAEDFSPQRRFLWRRAHLHVLSHSAQQPLQADSFSGRSIQDDSLSSHRTPHFLGICHSGAMMARFPLSPGWLAGAAPVQVARAGVV